MIPTPLQRRSLAFLVSAIAIVIAGCQRGPELGTVSGVIRVNGQPLPYAYVQFQPTTPPRIYGSAYADAEGRYELQFSESQMGAPVGQHRVSIQAARGDELPDDAPGSVRIQLPASYNESTELVRDVKPGHNEIDFDLVVNLPAKTRQARR